MSTTPTSQNTHTHTQTRTIILTNTNIASIPVSAALSLNDFKQGRLHGSQTLLTYMQGVITVKTSMKRVFFFIERCDLCVCLCVCLPALSSFLCAKCEFVYLCAQRSCVPKEFKRGATHRPTSADWTGITWTSHVSLGSKSACHRASSSHPCSLNSYFSISCIFFITAQSFIGGDSSSNADIFVLRWLQLERFTPEF